jgi:hypothetical protein
MMCRPERRKSLTRKAGRVENRENKKKRKKEKRGQKSAGGKVELVYDLQGRATNWIKKETRPHLSFFFFL